VWVLLTFVMTGLFLFTSRPILRSFTAWEANPLVHSPVQTWQDGETIDDLVWINDSGSIFATASVRPKQAGDDSIQMDAVEKEMWRWQLPPERVFDITFRDTLSNREIGRIQKVDYFPGRICMSPDNCLVANEGHRYVVWNLQANKQVTSLPKIGYPIAFSSTGKFLLLRSNSRMVTVWSVDEEREIDSLNFGLGFMISWTGFFDKRDRPFAIVLDHLQSRIEIWDILGKNRISTVAVEGSFANLGPFEARHLQRAKQGIVVAIVNTIMSRKPLAMIWSSEGKLLGSFVHDDSEYMNFALSSDGRYFVHGADQEFSLLKQLAELWPSFARRIALEFPTRKESRIHDLSTGQSWTGLPECERATFVQGTDRLVIFNKAGRYEFDAPPRWQYFTPWAWVALGVWVSWIALWWKSHRRRREVLLHSLPG
jgi:hypothetical protein